ncbi:enoyl-CoA hydratase/isomerase family protein [Pelomonas sp. V22]|uniref:enoyl-CoA hydratase-related protein n=1 Tax=Pelomonas sp. V22 TaxID=2822139 RepID=UPI0024A958D9|nr:enoyl-CoA hydratase-related protein [Pelomonas sp. V22]MDI4632157.1 enoyl-CoA hydratase/isomerase family protein [Pelomonas sp. V22]
MSDSPETAILISNEGAVRVLTLNRPAALNAFTAAMLAQTRAALAEAAEDATVKAVLITGAGRAFSAGQDLGDPLVKPDTSPDAAPKDIGHLLDGYYIPLALQLRAMPVPTIAAVNGVAAGAGANFALGCDLVIAGEGASFIQAFSKIGLIPDCGGTWLLPRLVGRAKALQLALLGDKLKAAEAASIGLIARAVPDAELMSEAMAMAQKLAAMPSRALAETRRLIDQAMDQDYEDALRMEAMMQSQLGFAHDYSEGVRAFMEKRSPQFKDR